MVRKRAQTLLVLLLHVSAKTPSHLLDDGDLTEISRRPALDQRNICCQTHPVHVIPRRWRRQTVKMEVWGDAKTSCVHTQAVTKVSKFAYLGCLERS